ncbi:MAG: pitrilysin family protein [Flammeovirgaceae bacterium]
MLLDRSIAPVFHPIKDFAITKANLHYLANRLPLYYIKAGEQEVASLQLLFSGGKWYEKQKGDAYFTAKMMLEGTLKHTAKQINEEFDFYGAFISCYGGYDKFFIDTHCLSKHLPNILDLIIELITEASFPKEEWQLVQKIALQELQVNLEKNSFVAGQLFRKHIFGENHPYGYSLTEEMIENFSLQRAKHHFQHFLLHQPFEIILAGKLDDKTFEQVKEKLGSLKINYSTHFEGFNGKPEPSLQAKVYQEKKDASQTSLRIGMPIIHRNYTDKIPLQVLNEILGGYFGSRLMQNLREEKGYTYGIHSLIVSFLQESYFLISADVIKEHKDKALEEIYKEIKLLKTQQVGEEELEKVKYHMAGDYIKSINTAFSLAEYFKTIHFQQLPQNYYDTYISKINSIKSSDILEVANKYFKEENFIEVLVG